MPSIGQAIGYEEINELKVNLEVEEPKFVKPSMVSRLGIDLFAKSVGDIEEYKKHILNFDKTESTGRILRGIEGIGLECNLAIIDIFIGFMMKFSKKGVFANATD